MTHRFVDAPRLPRFIAEQMPFERRAISIDERRIHFVDEGAGQPVLLVHGNPTWSYLWRRVIADLRGLRSIAPDLLGLGLSDKPLRVADHSLALHVQLITRLVEALDLSDVVLVGQDWGGPIAAGVATHLPGRVAGLVLANTSVLRPARPFRSKAFHRFSHLPVLSDLAFRGLAFPVPVMDRVQGERRSIGPAEKAAYLWPLLRPWERAAPLALARMVPDREGHPSLPLLDRIGTWVANYRGPAALVWGTRDPILGRALARHRAALPQATVVETTAGHFLQEEVPGVLAAAIRGLVS